MALYRARGTGLPKTCLRKCRKHIWNKVIPFTQNWDYIKEDSHSIVDRSTIQQVHVSLRKCCRRGDKKIIRSRDIWCEVAPPRKDREATVMIPQWYGCLTWTMTVNMIMWMGTTLDNELQAGEVRHIQRAMARVNRAGLLMRIGIHRDWEGMHRDYMEPRPNWGNTLTLRLGWNPSSRKDTELNGIFWRSIIKFL